MQEQKQKQKQKRQQKKVPSAIVLGSQDVQITEFLYCQSEFRCVQGEKLFLYISNKLVLLKPRGLNIQIQQREKYFQEIQMIFKLDYETLTKIFLIITDSDSNDFLKYFAQILKNWRSHVTLIHIRNVECQDDPIQFTPNFDKFEDVIQCYTNDDISQEMFKRCTLDEDSFYNPPLAPLEEIQSKSILENKQSKQEHQSAVQEKATFWKCLDNLLNHFTISPFSNLHPRLKI